MKKTALLIMAAGLGSRFGEGIKQLEKVGFHNEIIMDYSIHDAIQAGFNQIIIVIRRDIEEEFRAIIGKRLETICQERNVELTYCFQDLHDIPKKTPEGRKKPWGTGHAVLAARNIIECPFAVINADDYYGKEAFQKMHDWLILNHPDYAIAMAGFVLKNTLSDFGGVTRGICLFNHNNQHVKNIIETKNIKKNVDSEGNLFVEADGKDMDPMGIVSMNFWGYPGVEKHKTAFMVHLQEGFRDFLNDALITDPYNAEFLLPVYINERLKKKKCMVEVLKTGDEWFGVTYKEDKPYVKERFEQLIANGIYEQDLYSDL